MEQRAGNSGSRPKGRGLIATVVFVLAWFAARAFLEMEGTTDAARVAAALLPVAPFAWLLWEIVKGVRSMDELEQRIQLEALALAFPLTLILLMTLGLLEIAIGLPAKDLSYRHVWAMLPALYFLGLTLARRRYR
jgi:hypothetical protein